MHLQDVSTALKAVAEVAHAGEQVVGSIDRARSRGYGFPILLGVGLGVGFGALLFSESARQQVRTWLLSASAVQANARANGGSTLESTAELHDEAAPPPH